MPRAAARLRHFPADASSQSRSEVWKERLGVGLLNRTDSQRHARPQAGERLLHTIGPRFDEIDVELAGHCSELREKPAGTVRITTDRVCRAGDPMPAMAKIAPRLS